MSADDARKAMQSYIRALGERGDLAEYFTDDVELSVVNTDIRVEGRQPTIDFINHFHTVAFDADPEMTNLVVEEQGAAAEFVFKGRHIGEFAGLEATGRDVRLPYSAVYDLSDNRIKAIRLHMCMGDLMSQLGSEAPGGS